MPFLEGLERVAAQPRVNEEVNKYKALHNKRCGDGGERKGWQVLVQEVAAWAYDRKGQSSVVANTRLGALATV